MTDADRHMADEIDSEPTEPLHLDPEVIAEMKRHGMERPKGVPISLWKDPQELNHRHDEIIRLMLEGKPKTFIAEVLGYSYQHVIDLTNGPSFKEAYAVRRAERDIPVDKKRMQAAFNPAFDVMEELMMNKDEKSSVRLSAAQYILDQSVGKASQEVQVKQTGLIDVIHRLDEMRNARQAIDATAIPILDSNITPVDALLNEIVPDGFTVGKKREVESDGEIPEAES